MARLTKPDSGVTIAESADSWRRSMVADNKAPKTISTYLFAIKRLVAYLGDREVGKVTRKDHEAWLAHELETLKPSSVATLYRSTRSFWKWAVDHDDMPVDHDPMNGMKAPMIPEQSVAFVTDDELRAMLASCKGGRHNFMGHRDEAIIRLLATTAARLSEVANLTLHDVDLPGQVVEVVGKGRRPRLLPLDEPTFAALKLYLEKERPRHPASRTTDRVWLARAGIMTPNGIAQMVATRGLTAGVKHRVHPHEFRHRQIATLLGAGFSEGDVMSISGHRSRSMMDRYGAFTKSQRAHDAFRKASASGALPRI